MTTGFTGGDAATGPTAGFDPVLGKFRRKVKSKKDKKLVMPGNELKAEDNRNCQEKLNDVILEKRLERINKLREQGYEISEEQLDEILGGMQSKATPNAGKSLNSRKSLSIFNNPAAATGGSGGLGFGKALAGAGNTRMSAFARGGAGKDGRNYGRVPLPGTSGTSGSSLSQFKKPTPSTPSMQASNRPGLRKASSGGKIKESRENPTFPSRLFQYKVTIPEVGETIIYANSLAELTQKMRLLVNPRYRGDIKIERILPGKAAQFFMDKRTKHMKNIKEEESKDAKEQADDKIRAAKKKVLLKKQEMQKQLATKTRQLKRAAAAGQAPAEDN